MSTSGPGATATHSDRRCLDRRCGSVTPLCPQLVVSESGRGYSPEIMSRTPGSGTEASGRPPLLARLRVGTKLMVLVLIPVLVLLGLTVASAASDSHRATQLRAFQAKAQVSIATVRLIDALANERAATVKLRLQPSAQTQDTLNSAHRATDDALAKVPPSVAAAPLPIKAPGTDAVNKQLPIARSLADSGVLPVQQSGTYYSVLIRGLLETVGSRLAGPPTLASERAANAYFALLETNEAAAHEQIDLAILFSTPKQDRSLLTVTTKGLEASELDTFNANASGTLRSALNAVLSSPAGVQVQQLRNEITSNPQNVLTGTTSPAEWWAVSGSRLAHLYHVQTAAANELVATNSQGLGAVRTAALRSAALLLAVLGVVLVVALAIRRSISRPLEELSVSARGLSRGDFDVDIQYAGRDEIGDVAAAFRDLRVTTDELAHETGAMNTAVVEDRLDYRVGNHAFEGTWARIVVGMNEVMAAFEESHGRRRQAEGQLEDFFDLSPDLLCIAGDDGYFKRVSQAAEVILGYSTEELLSRPLVEFIHPDDRADILGNPDLSAGKDFDHFKNRYIRSDGSECWLEWNARAAPEEGLRYVVGRDVTDIRRVLDEQAALRRVATLVAEAAPPATIFTSVAEEVVQLLDVEVSALWRYLADGAGEIVAQWSEGGQGLPVGLRVERIEGSLTDIVHKTRRPARVDRYTDDTGVAAREIGIQSSVGVPIIVEGELWGLMAIVSTSTEPPPPGTEERLAAFTELVATAVANAQARQELRSIADEQAALGRVATLVAQGEAPAGVFGAVAEQVGKLLGTDDALVARFEPDESVTIVASWAAKGEPLAVGFRRHIAPGEGVTPLIRQTGLPARIDSQTDYYEWLGVDSAVAAPITVEGRLWGLVGVALRGPKAAPADTEDRLAVFTGLVATAIANAESRTQLVESRARIVAASDEARRRIERDLHDGAQQRLVSLALQLRKVQGDMPPGTAARLDAVGVGLSEALDELGELARGIHPPILAERGLGPAVKGLARRSAIPVEVTVRTAARLPEPIEIAAYYVVSEALTNASKHANATAVMVTIEADADVLRVTVRDNGVGGADFTHGTGLIGLKDRVEALNGHILLDSDPGAGTKLSVEIPIPVTKVSTASD